METLILYGWIYPSVFMVTWTILTFVVMRLTRKMGKLPFFVSLNILHFRLNPKDNTKYQDPTVFDTMVVLMLMLIPIGSLLLLLAEFYIVFIYTYVWITNR